MSFTRGQQSLDYHRVAGVGSVRKARNTVKQRIISDTAASPVSLKVVGGRIHTVWTVSLQGMTPRCSAGTLFLCHAPRGSRNTHAQRGRTVSCRWCVFVYPGLQLSDFHVTPPPSAQAMNLFCITGRRTPEPGHCSIEGLFMDQCIRKVRSAFKQTRLQNCVCLFGFMLLHI